MDILQGASQPVFGGEAAPQSSTESDVERRDRLILEWREAKKQADHFRAVEVELRKAIDSDASLFDQKKEEGTQTYELGGGWKLKSTRKQNYNLANKDGETIDAITRIHDASEAGALLSNRLVSWKPELRIGEYKQLPPEFKLIVDEVLTIKPGTPELKLEPPKKKE